MHYVTEESKGNCPVCRKVFLAKDIEHARDLVGMQSHSVCICKYIYLLVKSCNFATFCRSVGGNANTHNSCGGACFCVN